MVLSIVLIAVGLLVVVAGFVLLAPWAGVVVAGLAVTGGGVLALPDDR